MNKIKILALFMIFGCAASGQSYIMARVVDAKTNKGLAFANIVIKGVLKGTASNFDGEFSIHISEKNKSDTLLISIVGYKSRLLPISEFVSDDMQIFKLEPSVYQISDVTVQSKSLYYHTIIKRAAEKIEKNYGQKEFNYETYYRNKEYLNSKIIKERQAAITIYDAKGYQFSSAYEAYKNRGYEFVQVRRNFNPQTLSDRSTRMDELLEFDVVRSKGNVLNPVYIYEKYDVKLDKITEIDGDSVWVIKFSCKDPGISQTGDNYAKAYKGKLFIKMKDYALIKYEASYESSNISSLGRSLIVNEEKQEDIPQSIKYNVTTRYKDYNGVYFLSSITYDRTNSWKPKKGRKNKENKVEAQLLVTEVKVKDPKVIVERAYYEEVPFNPAFWKSFNYLKDEAPKRNK